MSLFDRDLIHCLNLSKKGQLYFSRRSSAFDDHNSLMWAFYAWQILELGLKVYDRVGFMVIEKVKIYYFVGNQDIRYHIIY